MSEEKRPQFGNRLLTKPDNVFEHNAWDNVVWDSEQESEAKGKVEKNSQDKVSEEKQNKYENEADQFWDSFYQQHQNRFFKDRQWLFTEFPELAPDEALSVDTPERVSDSSQGLSPSSAATGTDSSLVTEQAEGVSPEADSEKDKGCERTEVVEDGATAGSGCSDSALVTAQFPGADASTRFFEVGCGVGNTVFPVLKTNIDPKLFVYCCDLSASAIQLVKEHPDYSGGRCHGFVCDVTDPQAQLPFPEASLDIVVLIFVLSAVNPHKMQDTINRLARHLKPGGKIIFRDYGRYDLTQLRFKNGQCLADNFYVRGDGTRVYFFTQEEMRDMFTKAGLVEEQNLIDRRLQVNRGKQIKMYRVWIQCKYTKPLKPL